MTLDSTPAQVGAQCGEVVEGTAKRIVSCANGAFCRYDFNDGATATCHPLVQLGQPCAQGDRCAGLAQCVPTGPTTQVCTTITVHASPGFSCAPAAVAVCDPTARLFCDQESQTCKALGDGSVGAVCATKGMLLSVPGLPCDSGNYCDEDTQLCAAQLAVGEPCEDSDACADDGYCDQVCQASSCF